MRYILASLPLALAVPLAARDEAASGPSKYIVILKADAPSPQSSSGSNHIAGGAVASVAKDHVYSQGDFKGFAATLTNDQVSALRQDPTVSYVFPTCGNIS